MNELGACADVVLVESGAWLIGERHVFHQLDEDLLVVVIYIKPEGAALVFSLGTETVRAGE